MNYDKLAGNSTETVRKVVGRPFPKGVSGNPSGRPPKSLYQRKMEEVFNNPQVVEKLIKASIATMTNPRAMVAGVMERRNNQERVDGAVKQEIEVSGELRNMTDEEIQERLQRVLEPNGHKQLEQARERGADSPS